MIHPLQPVLMLTSRLSRILKMCFLNYTYLYTSQVKFFMYDNVKGLTGPFPVLFGCLLKLLSLSSCHNLPGLPSLPSPVCLNPFSLFFHSSSIFLTTTFTWKTTIFAYWFLQVHLPPCVWCVFDLWSLFFLTVSYLKQELSSGACLSNAQHKSILF